MSYPVSIEDQTSLRSRLLLSCSLVQSQCLQVYSRKNTDQTELQNGSCTKMQTKCIEIYIFNYYNGEHTENLKCF